LQGAKRLIESSLNLKIVMEWDLQQMEQYGDVSKLIDEMHAYGFKFYHIPSKGRPFGKPLSKEYLLKAVPICLRSPLVPFRALQILKDQKATLEILTAHDAQVLALSIRVFPYCEGDRILACWMMLGALFPRREEKSHDARRK
jgi:hypothetical protein